MKKRWIEFKDYSFTYAGRPEPALKDIDLSINYGEKVLILGENGSGKTSLLRALAGELGGEKYPGEVNGTLIVNDEGVSEADKQIAKYFGDLNSNQELHYQGQDSDSFAGRLWSLLAPVPEPTRQKTLAELSAGEQDMYHFIEMVEAKEPVYIFDEPLANLAPRTSRRFIEILDDFYVHTAATVIIAAHRMEPMMYRHIDRVIVLLNGSIIFQGSLDSLLHNDVLGDLNIREPLYITAMRYAGYPFHQLKNISNVEKIHGPHLRATMENWVASIPSFRFRQSRETLFEMSDVSYFFAGQKQGVRDISLKVKRGEMISIAGDNGAGKSTLARLISGDLEPMSGAMHWYGGYRRTGQAGQRPNISYIPHNFEKLLTERTVGEQVHESLRHENLLVEEKNERAHAALYAMGLWFAREMPIRFLSYGQKKRLVLACALATEPELLIIDEPTEGQDSKHYIEFMGYLYRVNQQHNIALIINSHDIEVMLSYTRRTLVMAAGELIADDVPVQVATNPYLMKRSGLKETSLARFARTIGLVDPYNFIQKFMDYDREIKQVNSLGAEF